jgi:hypothetical protein
MYFQLITRVVRRHWATARGQSLQIEQRLLATANLVGGQLGYYWIEVHPHVPCVLLSATCHCQWLPLGTEAQRHGQRPGNAMRLLLATWHAHVGGGVLRTWHKLTAAMRAALTIAASACVFAAPAAARAASRRVEARQPLGADGQPLSPYECILPDMRPPVGQRTYVAPSVDAAIAALQPKFKNPALGQLFANSLPNPLDTCVYSFTPPGLGPPDTFVVRHDDTDGTRSGESRAAASRASRVVRWLGRWHIVC